ncbi:cell division protein FtsL [Vibrio tubiashii]|jgi:cell division protein FtsL|uniref:cell division protein FtsL n=1 Tax=Vibrio tubiashii TaxID=29498 RepID=UPI001EFCC84D|nr:cell division protein FtsL [Vibrio tubiashii]MCG9574895.1 cell division protein FtsL [Vibrio tubiashii]MCG9581597.1 cell division protein FtsL [Vibrio tubiashii]MCG9615188.1 cell division protein FtsL [Vibrio tubiashii]MCG9685818.1 cell division protein FtsL [Vibrio tubiashii]WCP66577.1 cell division protein FtsL [Vibrio tubiashii]
MSKPAPNLAKLIALDLLSVGRVPLILLVLIFSSAMGVVFTTHHTRQAITEKDQALVERERLDNEWRNLLIEETALAEHSRVQAVAKTELEMKRPDSDKEVIINLP